MLMLMAREYTVVNTTMFFGPAPGQSPSVKTSSLAADTPTPVELDLANSTSLTLAFELLTGADFGTPSPNNPTTWDTYATSYVEYGSLSPIPSVMLISSSADDNGPGFFRAGIRPQSFAQPGAPGWQNYLFDSLRDVNNDGIFEPHNAAAGFYAGPPATVPVYGLGDATINAYPRFETMSHILVSAASTIVAGRRLSAPSAAQGAYEMGLMDPTLLTIGVTGVGSAAAKNVLLSRVAVTPADIRIEAGMYAEEGSFFVIPGQWFNGNSEDNRDDFANGAGAYSGLSTPQEKNMRRYRHFGNVPETPFYNEPLPVRVQISGAISENMPAPMSQQTEWKRKWAWMPRQLGSTGTLVPNQWVPNGFDATVPGTAIPNFLVNFDPALATASAGGVPIRRDEYGRVLPPAPRLPVSPTLAYVGDPKS
jgi:hypothetical protein